MENIDSEKIFGNVEFHRFGIICMLILVVGCMSGFAVGLGAVESTFLLTLVVIPTMAMLALLLAVAPMKQILTAAGIAGAVDLALIAYFLLT